MNHVTEFKPRHIQATKDDLKGNNGIGRYFFIPGSDERAQQISEHFFDLQTKTHARGHTLYLGKLKNDAITIDVASVSSGMGCPSMEIILHELFQLGAKRFLRVGTAGSLQPDRIKCGDFINVTASVRDESTSSDYIPPEVPAIASLDYITSILASASQLYMRQRTHSGIVHCKSSLYGREFGAGPLHTKNTAYTKTLANYGVLATEMETAALFTQSQYYNHLLRSQGDGPAHRVLAGAILGIISIPPDEFCDETTQHGIAKDLIDLAIASTLRLAINELIEKKSTD